VKFDFYDADDARGTRLGSDSISFTVTAGTTPAPEVPPPPPPPVEGGGSATQGVKYFLADADTNKLLIELADGATINSASYNGHSLSVVAVADTTASGIQSIRMGLDGGQSRVEDVEPYALFGDRSGDLRGGLTAGEHNVKFDFYDADGARGTHLGSDSISFTVASSSALSEGSIH